MSDGDQYKLGYQHGYEDRSRERDYDPGNRWDTGIFLSWLAAHDRAVAAKAWDAGWDARHNYDERSGEPPTPNPHDESESP